MQSTPLAGIKKVFHGTGEYLGKVTIDRHGYVVLTEACKITIRESDLTPGQPVKYVEGFTDKVIRLAGSMMIADVSEANMPDYKKARAAVDKGNN